MGHAPLEVEVHNEPMTTDSPSPDGPVFLCVDSMETRKELMENLLIGNIRVPIVIETRMAARHGMVYTINPNRSADVRYWRTKWYPDSAVVEETTACGTAVTVAPTAMLVGSLAAWQFIRWANGGALESELVVCADSPMLEVMAA